MRCTVHPFSESNHTLSLRGLALHCIVLHCIVLHCIVSHIYIVDHNIVIAYPYSWQRYCLWATAWIGGSALAGSWGQELSSRGPCCMDGSTPISWWSATPTPSLFYCPSPSHHTVTHSFFHSLTQSVSQLVTNGQQINSLVYLEERVLMTSSLYYRTVLHCTRLSRLLLHGHSCSPPCFPSLWVI